MEVLRKGGFSSAEIDALCAEGAAVDAMAPERVGEVAQPKPPPLWIAPPERASEAA